MLLAAPVILASFQGPLGSTLGSADGRNFGCWLATESSA
jgi:hypothetical protein